MKMIVGSNMVNRCGQMEGEGLLVSIQKKNLKVSERHHLE